MCKCALQESMLLSLDGGFRLNFSRHFPEVNHVFCFRNPLLLEYCFGNKTLDYETIGNTTYAPEDVIGIPERDRFNMLINQPNVALMCTILCLGTFSLAYELRIFRNSHYLGRSARRAFGDFGVPISIVTFVIIDYLAGVKTEKLLVPDGLSTTQPNRTWIVDPSAGKSEMPVWMPFACAVPAFFVYILVFLETQISE